MKLLYCKPWLCQNTTLPLKQNGIKSDFQGLIPLLNNLLLDKQNFYDGEILFML